MRMKLRFNLKKTLFLALTISLCLISGKALYGEDSGKAGLTVSERKNAAKGDVVYKIVARSAPNNVEAFGFDVTYDPKQLKYKRYRRGRLTRNFQHLDVHEISPGHLRVGGFTLQSGITAGKSGTVIRLRFKTLGDAEGAKIAVKNGVDHMRAWVDGGARK